MKSEWSHSNEGKFSLRGGEEIGSDFEILGNSSRSDAIVGDIQLGLSDVVKNQRFDMSMYVAEGRDGGFLRHRRGEDTIRTLEVTLVRPEAVTAGRLVLTNKSLYFHPQRAKVEIENRQVSKQGNSDISSPYKSTQKRQDSTDRRWDLDTLTRVYGRRYLLKPDCAIEFFFADGSSAFVVCHGGKPKRDQVRLSAKLRHYRCLLNL